MMCKRENIYSWDDNPYLYWLKEYVKFLKENHSITLFHELQKYIYCWRFKSKIFKQIELKCFLKKIPQAAYWEDDQIRKANVLFISNEPGLTNVETLYEDFVEKDLNDLNDEEYLEFIADQFKKSMKSWLALIDHEKLKKINGEKITQEELDSKDEYKKFEQYGKIAYFLRDNELSQKDINIKCIHIDLFPFAQSNGYDKNPLNFKDKINKCINSNLELKHNNCGYSNKWCNFTCDIIKNSLSTIKKFCNNQNTGRKYLLIIGNRANIHQNSLKHKCDNGKDNSKIIYNIIRYTFEKGNINIRISKKWPLGFSGLEIFKPHNGVDINSKGLELTKILPK